MIFKKGSCLALSILIDVEWSHTILFLCLIHSIPYLLNCFLAFYGGSIHPLLTISMLILIVFFIFLNGTILCDFLSILIALRREKCHYGFSKRKTRIVIIEYSHSLPFSIFFIFNSSADFKTFKSSRFAFFLHFSLHLPHH